MNFGLISDGNRRWAKKNGFEKKIGHQKGFRAIKDIIFPVLYDSLDFQAFTVYAFSTENWKRSPGEVKYLMELYAQIIDEWLPELIEKKVQVVHAGRKDRIPKFLKEKIEEAEEKTVKNKDFTIYFCLDYGGRDEIVRAADQGKIEKNLEVPDLDIILRTGGERRISNFCIWQAAYAEFFFLDKFLPEIEKEDVEEVLEDFLGRDRRQGE